MEEPPTLPVIESDFKFKLAATYLEDAISHRHFDFNHSPQGVKLYRYYKLPVLRYLLYFCFLVDIGLAFVEVPARPGWEWPLWATLFLELCCLIYFSARLFHEMLSSVNIKTFWKDTKHVTNALIIVVTLIDICVYVVMMEGRGSSSTAALRISRALRPFLLVNFTEARQIRRAFRNIRRTLPDLANVLILFLASLSLFSLMAVKLFQRRHLENGMYFNDFFDAFWDLYVLVTTANYPSIQMPAYDSNRGFFVFFLAFLLVNLYLFMRVFLAVIYNSYKNNLRLEVEASLKLKRDLLRRSFESLNLLPAVSTTGDSSNLGNSFMSKDAFKNLMKWTAPDRNEEFLEVCWLILDFRNQRCISFDEFSHVPELMDMRIVNIHDKRNVWFPEVYHNTWSKMLIRCIRHIYFRYLFDAIIFLNALFIGFDLDGGEPFFLALFALEILSKLYAFGFRAFARKLWNIFDVIVVGSALLVTLIEAIRQQSQHTQVALDFLMVLRVIRIFKIFHSVMRFRIVINTILHILPSMVNYGGVLLVFYYSFALIGMEAFGGKIRYFGYDESNQSIPQKYCGNALLKDSQFYREHYCSNNFNDLFSALVTLFELMTVNQWHVITSGYVSVTSKYARLYFFCFHFICVTVILNIFSAFVIEAFILEFSVTSSDNNNGAGGKRPQSTLLADRIAAMGLGYGKAEATTKQLRGNNKNAVADRQELVHADDDDNDNFIDADHDGTTQLPNNKEASTTTTTTAVSSSISENMVQYADHSSQTGLRFVLNSRTRTVMGLLEKMFET